MAYPEYHSEITPPHWLALEKYQSFDRFISDLRRSYHRQQDIYILSDVYGGFVFL